MLPQTVHCNEVRLFLGQGILTALTIDVAHLISYSSSRHYFNIFCYDVVLNRDSNQLPPRRRADVIRVESRPRVIFFNFVKINDFLCLFLIHNKLFR